MVETKIADPSRLHYYYLEHIAEEEKAAYERILKGLYDMVEEISMADLQISVNRFTPIKRMVFMDHPEIFWTNGTCSYTSSENRIQKVFFKYTMNSAEKAACQIEIDQVLQFYTEVLRGRMKDYEAALKIYERMIDLLDYDSIALEREKRNRIRGKDDRMLPDHLRSIYGALVNKKAVCAGYAKGFQYIIQTLGIECLSVIGPCKGKGDHQWNIIRLNGKYYHIDVTWGDGSNTDSNKSRDGISYNYYCLTDKDIRKSRSIDPLLPVPSCTATKCNYFRLKKLYVDKYDFAEVTAIIKKQLSKKKYGKIQIRFASAAMLKIAEKELFTDRKIFKILDDSGVSYGTVWHNKDEEMYVLTLWAEKKAKRGY